jgi:hypothetical protein
MSQTQYTKRLSIVLVALALNGCALYDALMMTNFDSNEYYLVTQIRTDAQVYKTQCDNPALAPVNAQAISLKTRLFENYSEQIPNNENGIKASVSLNEIAQGLNDAYRKGTPSPVFCKLKYGGIENAAYVIQHVVGNRPR